MKAIRVRFDEDLLTRSDSTTAEAQRFGRSEVFRRAESREAIAIQYRKAYEDDAGLGPEFEGWGDQGVWPSE